MRGQANLPVSENKNKFEKHYLPTLYRTKVYFENLIICNILKNDFYIQCCIFNHFIDIIIF